jgi:hypothetical protein
LLLGLEQRPIEKRDHSLLVLLRLRVDGARGLTT